VDCISCQSVIRNYLCRYMRIAINARCLVQAEMDGCGYFFQEIFDELAKQQPQHTLLFLSDKQLPASFNLPLNSEAIVVKGSSKNAFSLRWWLDVKIPLALRKHKADIFVSEGYCSLLTSVPQVLVLFHLGFVRLPKLFANHDLFYKTRLKKFINKAKAVATVSEFSKQDISDYYKVAAEKIINVSAAARQGFQPAGWQQREAIKEQYTGGSEYFVVVGPVHPHKNLMNVLKAFSIFKKRQKTNLKLVIAGKVYDETTGKLTTYKYKDEVKVIGYLQDDELSQLISAAYALIYPSMFEGFGMPIVEAMLCDVPVLTSNTSSMPEVAGDVALLFDPSKPEEIAEQMKLIFKDEQLRNTLIQRGRERVTMYSWEESAKRMWAAIEQAVSK
jgi:glycosyltransferase involved in cell wall biosynthesis